MEASTAQAAAAISAMSAATVDLIEAIRSDGDVAATLQTCEVTENVADALQSVLNLELDALPPGERREMVGQLLAACTRFLEGWA